MVDRDSEEAETIRKYVKNTHATTHNAYDLEVVDVRIFLLLPAPSSLGLGRKEQFALL